MFHDAVREAVCKDYLSALEDLTFNSKHYINMLTKLAKENLYFAKDIVAIVEAHIVKAPATQKLPVLYLVDSIVKNLKGHYLAEFAKNITILFVSVFEKVDCDTRKTLRRLRDTWDDVFSLETLYALDMHVRCIDPNWAIKSVPPTVESSLSLTSSLRQPAANQLGLTGANTTEVRRQQQHRTTPVKEDEETEPNPRMRCADNAEGDTAIVSELRATSRAGKLQREGAGFPPGPVNKKKRSCPGSLPPSLLSKGNDSRSSESTSGVTFSSSARRGKGKRVPGRQFPLPKNVKEEKTDSTSTARFIPLEGAKGKQ
ncbi:uncharacterized protein LOC118209147 [Anguilla anguilla]|uniref:uncharacterized protein LOC118209147 n=1 Tax=Anguilla anguilla TaxID=7936 RepID=UPI0015AA7501|nr:uncharacterized protein LOC118209147 [Anguilla anguilla]